uniref:Uncharacterized protein n=1 Tax=mine drainage metagenome TaxID=410659 RepID=E6QL99_9ZZZZ
MNILKVQRVPGVRRKFFRLEFLLATLRAVFHLLNLSHAYRAEMARNFDIETINQTAAFRRILYSQKLKDSVVQLAPVIFC